MIATHNANIPKSKFLINQRKSLKVSKPVRPGIIKITPNHPAAKLIKSWDRIFKISEANIIFTKAILTY